MQQQRELQRDYFFEFAGMPQSGKSTVEDIVAQYLRDLGLSIEEYRGGSRYSPLRFSPIADLNVLLACKAAEFVISVSGQERAMKKIFLMDRGPIDRYIFTETLLRLGKIREDSARATQKFLTIPQLVQGIDGVFVFTTTPDRALQRENESKLLAAREGQRIAEREVMNRDFLAGMRSAIEDSKAQLKKLMPRKHFQLIDTDERDGKEKETAEDIAKTILDTVEDQALI